MVQSGADLTMCRGRGHDAHVLRSMLLHAAREQDGHHPDVRHDTGALTGRCHRHRHTPQNPEGRDTEQNENKTQQNAAHRTRSHTMQHNASIARAGERSEPGPSSYLCDGSGPGDACWLVGCGLVGYRRAVARGARSGRFAPVGCGWEALMRRRVGWYGGPCSSPNFFRRGLLNVSDHSCGYRLFR